MIQSSVRLDRRLSNPFGSRPALSGRQFHRCPVSDSVRLSVPSPSGCRFCLVSDWRLPAPLSVPFRCQSGSRSLIAGSVRLPVAGSIRFPIVGSTQSPVPYPFGLLKLHVCGISKFYFPYLLKLHVHITWYVVVHFICSKMRFEALEDVYLFKSSQ